MKKMNPVGLQLNAIPEDLKFLNKLILLSEKNSLNSPGPYWEKTARRSIREIRKRGLSSFRDFGSNVGESYADSPIIDIRPSLQGPLRSVLRFFISKIFPFNKVFNNQVNLTSSYFKILMEKESAHIQNSPEIHGAICRLNIPEDTTRGGCVAVTNINGKSISNTYLEALALIDKIDTELGYDGVKSLMEIGAGFGVNIHLLIENYPNIRKYLLVDISPTLYVSTQYLKSYYGDAVIDAVSYEENSMTGFKDNGDLEIICLLPSQLSSFMGTIDFFYNAHSFVEMTEEIVSGYSREISRLQSGSKLKKIALCTYRTCETQKTVS